MSDLDAVLDAAGDLEMPPRTQRWAHVSLCVLDAVFSVGARYTSTVSTCRRYAETYGLQSLVHIDAAASVIGTGDEQPLGIFVAHVREHGVDEFAALVLRNRQRTSTGPSGVLKAEAALRYAEALVEAGVERYAEVAAAFGDRDRMDELSVRLRVVPGHGTSDVRLGYLWMLLGDDDTINPDPMVLRWLGLVLGRGVSPQEARELVTSTAAARGCTPWEWIMRSGWRSA